MSCQSVQQLLRHFTKTTKMPISPIVVKIRHSGPKVVDWPTNFAIPRATQLAWLKNQITWRSVQLKWSIYQLSTVLAVGWRFMTPPARLGNGQPASPMRLMAHCPHLDPFISCFQNDISLATEDQQAWREQRSPVSWSRTNTGQESMPRSQQAETDRATMDPPLTSV